MTKNNSYFTNNKYDVAKSERRRREIRAQFSTKGFTPNGISTDEWLRQKAERSTLAIENLMSLIVMGNE